MADSLPPLSLTPTQPAQLNDVDAFNMGQGPSALQLFPPTVAAPGNEAALAESMPQGLGPLDPMKNIGGTPDVAATMNALQENIQANGGQVPQNGMPAVPQTEDPGSFAQPSVPAQAQAPQMPEIGSDNKGIMGTFDTRQQANKAIANAAADKAAAEVGEQLGLAKQMEKQQAEIESKKLNFESAFNDKMKYLDKIADDLKGQDFSTAKVNANRFFENQSTGNQITTSLAVLLGGIGGALTGKGGNVGMDHLNKLIDRDIDEQKFNIQQAAEQNKMKAQNLRDQSSLGSNMLSELKGKFQSDLSAETALRGLMIQQTQNKLAAIASGFDNATVKDKAKELNAQLEAQKLMLGQQLKQQQATQFMQKSLAGADLSQLTPLQAASMGLSKETIAAIADTQARMVPGFHGQTKDKEAASKFTEYNAGMAPAIGAVKRIQDLSKNFNRVTDLKQRAKIETEVAGLVGALRLPLTGPGILTDSERQMLQTIVGDPTKLWSLPELQKARLGQISHKLQNDLNDTAKTYGLRPQNQAVQKYLRPVK